MNRRMAGAGGMRRDIRNAQAAPGGSSPPSLAALGADLLYHWEMALDGSPNITVVGGNVSSLKERVAGTANMVQGTAGSRPAYNASGFGPNSLPYMSLTDADRVITATISIAAANRASLYVICKAGNTNGFFTWRMLHATGGQTRMVNNATQFVHRMEFTGGAQIKTITSQAKDLNEHLHSFRAASTGALNQIDGANVVQAVVGSDTVPEATSFSFGSGGGGSDTGAGMYATIIVNDATAAKDTIVKTYVAAVTGLTLA